MKRVLLIVLAMVLAACIVFACAEEQRVMQTGDKGEDVKAVQERLIELGYLNGKADGVYGKGTARAITAYQEDVGLVADGIANLATQNALFTAERQDYVLNKKSKKFHYPDCSGVKSMSEKNREDVTATRDELIEQGYDPCGTCKP